MKKNIREAFKSSFTNDGDEFVSHPIDTGSTKRPADKAEAGEKASTSATSVPELKGGTGDASRPADKKPEQGDKQAALPKTKSGVLVDLLNRASKMKRADLTAAHSNVVKALGESVEEAEDVTLQSVVAEDLVAMFEGTELSEEFQTKATALFEAAVNLRVASEVATIEEQLIDRYATMLEEQLEEINGQVDQYMTETVNEWLAENRLAVESGIRADISESFINGLKTLFAEHYVDVPDDKVDVVEELSDSVVTLEAQVAEQAETIEKLLSTLEEQAKADIVSEAVAGLPQTQVDRLKTMVEGISFSDLDDYRQRVTLIRESFLNEGTAKKTTTTTEVIAEETAGEDDLPVAIADPVMQRYAAAISRLSPQK